MDENNFQTDRHKILCKERLEQKLLNLSKLNILVKDIYRRVRKFASKVQFSCQLQLKYQTFDPILFYFHISDIIRLNQEIFEKWMNDNRHCNEEINFIHQSFKIFYCPQHGLLLQESYIMYFTNKKNRDDSNFVTLTIYLK